MNQANIYTCMAMPDKKLLFHQTAENFFKASLP